MDNRHMVWRLAAFVGLVFLLLTTQALATPPARLLNFSGELNDADGKPVADGDYTISFAVYDDPLVGSVQWTEVQLVTTKKGRFNVLLGSVTELPADLFSQDNRYLGMTVAPDVVEMTPRTQLVSVGNSFHALKSDSSKHSAHADTSKHSAKADSSKHSAKADSSKHAAKATRSDTADYALGLADDIVATNHIINGTILFEDIGDNGALDGQVMKWNAGTERWEAHDDALGGGGGDFLPLAGGYMTGPINCSGNPRPEIRMGKANFGDGNTNAGEDAFVAGGNNQCDGDFSTIGGGANNTIAADMSMATIGGGDYNAAASYAAVGGGTNNSAQGGMSTVAGGSFNLASGTRSVVAGGSNNRARGDYSVVAGGGGTEPDSNAALSPHSAIGGGSANVAGQGAASGTGATVSGGRGNWAAADYATISGGMNNQSLAHFATVGGGGGATSSEGNSAWGLYSTVAGGQSNECHGQASTVGGGSDNKANNQYSTTGGGQGNDSYSDWGVIGGGSANYVSGLYATVGGGQTDTASGDGATVPGGIANCAKGYASFAAGARAYAGYDGCFVWADNSSGQRVAATSSYQFIVRANGGIWLGTNNAVSLPPGRFINTSTGGYLSNAGAWTNSSDAALKENFSPVDGEDLLLKVMALPIARWNYKADPATVQHIGPTAQDFHAAFGVGNDSVTISTIDPSGVALAAIQALYAQLQSENAQLSQQIAELRQMVARLTDKQDRR